MTYNYNQNTFKNLKIKLFKSLRFYCFFSRTFYIYVISHPTICTVTIMDIPIVPAI